jgi:large subunit ribosomal protein L22
MAERRRKKKNEEAPEADAPGSDAPEADASGSDAAEADTPESDAPEADASPQADADAAAEATDADDGEPAAEKSARRRGSAETGARAQPRKAAPRDVDGEVVVRARARYVRTAPRKARLVMDHIRGRPVEQARAMLTHTPRAVSTDILKLLDSAIANAETTYELGADELRIRRAYVDEGPIIKRYRPRALGRATRINKRTSHMTIELTSGEG